MSNSNLQSEGTKSWQKINVQEVKSVYNIASQLTNVYNEATFDFVNVGPEVPPTNWQQLNNGDSQYVGELGTTADIVINDNGVYALSLFISNTEALNNNVYKICMTSGVKRICRNIVARNEAIGELSQVLSITEILEGEWFLSMIRKQGTGTASFNCDLKVIRLC